jgi:hypothetical protein
MSDPRDPNFWRLLQAQAAGDASLAGMPMPMRGAAFAMDNLPMEGGAYADPYNQIPITADGDEAAARAAQDQMYADNMQRVQDRSLVRYGDQQLIPNNLPDTLDMLGTGLSRAGEVSAAFPGMGSLIDEAGDALGAGLRYARSKPPIPEEIIPGASAEGDAILAARRAKREAERAERAQAVEYAERIARGSAFQAEAAKRGSTGTVPILSPRRDREALLRGLPEGTAPMAIAGRQGLPKRKEQINLIDKYLSMGGRADDLPSGEGPWGESVRAQVDRTREAINRAWSKDRALRAKSKAPSEAPAKPDVPEAPAPMPRRPYQPKMPDMPRPYQPKMPSLDEAAPSAAPAAKAAPTAPAAKGSPIRTKDKWWDATITKMRKSQTVDEAVRLLDGDPDLAKLNTTKRRRIVSDVISSNPNASPTDVAKALRKRVTSLKKSGKFYSGAIGASLTAKGLTVNEDE